MGKIDLQTYFDEGLTFTFKEKEFKVDGGNKTYQLCQAEIRKIVEEKKGEEAVTKAMFKYAFGDKYDEFMELDLPAKAYNDIALEIMAEWSGVSKEDIKKSMKIPSQK